jgi:hypothetical protein
MADTHPGDVKGDRLRAWWTTGPGLARWVSSPTPWTTLRDELLKAGVPATFVKKLATTYYVAVFGHGPRADH